MADALMTKLRELSCQEENFDPSNVKPEDVLKLPQQDIIWVAAITEGPGSEDYRPEEVLESNRDMRVMFLMDNHERAISGNAKNSSECSLPEQALDLLKRAMFIPMDWKPRRPKYFTMRFDQPGVNLPLHEYGIQGFNLYQDPEGPIGPELASLDLAETCATCRRRGSPQLFTKCPSCQVINYCSEECRQQHLSIPSDKHSHRYWCKYMADSMSKASQLAKLPFSFASETTAQDFTEKKLGSFLQLRGLYMQGLWRHESVGQGVPYGEVELGDCPYVLAKEEAILKAAPSATGPAAGLSSWAEYYSWRGFSLHSPIAVLMQWPLTIYHILQQQLPTDSPDQASMESRADQPFVIHLIGVEKEVDLVPVFWELNHLLPDVYFHLVMVGREISKKAHKREVTKGKVKVTIHKGLYGKFEGAKPHLVIGFNSGLGAYMTWSRALKKLKELSVPAYFTDYCEYSCACAKGHMEGLQLGTVTEPVVNPFRSPLRKHCEEQDMPWYSNAFIYHLKYAGS